MAYSLASRSSSLQGSASRNSKGMGAGAAAAMNKPCCPDSRIREASCNVARASSADASSDSRGPSESSAPDLIKLSKTRLFRKRDSMRSQKSRFLNKRSEEHTSELQSLAYL